jgi:hypothetical protein
LQFEVAAVDGGELPRLGGVAVGGGGRRHGARAAPTDRRGAPALGRALQLARGRRFRVYVEAPCFRPGPGGGDGESVKTRVGSARNYSPKLRYDELLSNFAFDFM